MPLFRQRLSLTLIATYLGLSLFAANALAQGNVCNAGIGGTGIERDGIGGTGNGTDVGGTGKQANSGVGGTGIDTGVGGTGKQATSGASSGVGGTGNGTGIGGTGIDTDVGGTGVQAASGASSGVGGTGIVGIITGFASVCVNGLEVHYDDKTKVDVDGQSSAINALDIGQLVAIESFNKGNILKAERISVSHIMVGKIEQINYSQNTMQILGQTVRYGSNTVGYGDFKVDQTVKVSGLQASNNNVYALRVDLAPANTPSSVVGLVSPTGDINGVRVVGDNRVSVGKNVQVSGNWDGKALRANLVQASAIDSVLRRSQDVIIQGFAPASPSDIKVQNQRIQTDANTKTNGVAKGADGNQTVIVRGKLDRAGNISARSIEYLGEDKILERGGSKQRPSLPEPAGRNSSKDKGQQTLGKEKHDNKNHDTKHKLDKPESASRPEKIEKPEKVEKIEKPEKIDKPEKIELPERVEMPEKIQLPERIEIPQRIERPEKIEIPETSRH
jgi:hypothetical protein